MKTDYLNPKGLFESPFFTHTVAAPGTKPTANKAKKKR